jgi:hypothetical protein
VAFCIAALSLFADRQAALRELRRVLAPGALAVLATGVQFWAQIIPWPRDLAARLATAYAQTLEDGRAPLPATPDVSEELARLLSDAGLSTPLIRAFLLERPPTTDHRPPTTDEASISHLPSPISHPLLAELPLLHWPALRPQIAGRLAAAELARCDAIAAGAEVELCSLLLVAQARAA